MESQRTDDRPARGEFFDRFLRERSISWILGIGTAIVLGSSTMLVAQEWHDATSTWKQSVMLAYTAALFGVGLWTYHRVLLRRTGCVLLGLTLCLLPLLLMALHWVAGVDGLVAARGPGLLEPSLDPTRIGLLVLTLVFTVCAATVSFRLLLRGVPATYLASYLILAGAGAFPPVSAGAWMPAVIVLLWGVLLIGTIKVGRHLFWLEEILLPPRVFGLFPVILLGVQFLALWGVWLRPLLALEWVGVGAVFTALPILIAADARAKIHQHRLGVLARPLPLEISATFVTAIVLAATGVGVSLVSFVNGGAAKGVMPAAAAAAVLAGLVARRTKVKGFVWAAIGCSTLAYNFSPAFFAAFAQKAVSASASSVAEEALPYAFYGVTYLPLIAAFALLAAWSARRGKDLLAGPLTQSTFTLTLILLLLATTHAKAWFPVGGALAAAFLGQGLLLRRPRVLLFAAISWGLAASGMLPFFALNGLELSREVPLLTTLALSGACLLVARRPSFAEKASVTTNPWVLMSGMFSLGTAGYYLFRLIVTDVALSGTPLMLGVVVVAGSALLLGIQAERLRSRALGVVAVVALELGGALVASRAGAELSSVLSLLTWVLAAQWFVGRRWSVSAGAGRFVAAGAERVAAMTLLGLSGPSFVASLARLFSSEEFLGRLGLMTEGVALCGMLMAAATTRRGPLAVIGMLGIYAWLAGLVRGLFPDLFPALPSFIAFFACLASLSVPVLAVLRRRWTEARASLVPVPDSAEEPAAVKPWWSSIDSVTLLFLAAGVAASLVWYQPVQVVAGAASVLGLFGMAWVQRRVPPTGVSLTEDIQRPVATGAWVAFNALVLSVVPRVLTTHAADLTALMTQADARYLAVFAVLAAVSRTAWRWSGRQQTSESRQVWEWTLALLSVTCLLASGDPHSELAIQLLGVATLAITALSETRRAWQSQHASEVVSGQVVLGLLVMWLHLSGALHLSDPIITLGLPLVAIAGRIVTEQLAPASRWYVFKAQWEVAAVVCAAAAPVVQLLFAMFSARAPFQDIGAMEIVGLLLSAGFFFERWLRSRRPRYLLTAAGFVNLTLLMIWRDLGVHHPEFILMPLGMTIMGLTKTLREELPKEARDPLTYFGALVILSAPTIEMIGGSWLHLFVVMGVSVLMVLLSIGFRSRPMFFLGALFLGGDLIAMVVLGSIDHPALLWVAGIILGAALVALGAVAESHRERLLGRIRALSAGLESWK